MIIRICTICSKELPATPEYFHRKRDGKYGLTSSCKVCNNSKSKKYYNNNLDETKRKHKSYYSSNKPKIAKQQKEYYKSNRKMISEKHNLYEKSTIGKKVRSEINRRYRQTKNGKITNKKHYEKWRKTDNYKIYKRKQKARRRNLGYIPLYENPFDESEEIEWHHINNEYVVAIPRDLHRLHSGSWEYHKDWCMEIVKQIYGELRCIQ